MSDEVPEWPTGLRRSGRALWVAVLGDFDLDEHELTILREACRTADSLDDLHALLEAERLMVRRRRAGGVHPALVELRQQRVTFARLLTALRIPTGEDSGRTQSRGGPRGVYPVRGGVVRRRLDDDGVPAHLAVSRSGIGRAGLWRTG